MGREQNENLLRARRLADFRRRAAYSRDSVYRHRSRGWEYIPVHPFGDEPELLERLGLAALDCCNADAWWAIDGDVTFLESFIGSPGRLMAKPTDNPDRWVYLVAVFDAPYVTRAAFEDAMIQFADAGFPHDPKFRLRWGDPWLPIRLGHGPRAT